MEKHSVVAVDIAKSVFDIAVSEEPGRVSLRRRLSRGGFNVFFAQLPASTVVMEACGMAHYWARELQKLGHTVVLLPPHQVRPYVTRNKTDRTGAKGILEAYRARYRAGSKSSIGFPSGSSTWTCRPPGPTSI